MKKLRERNVTKVKFQVLLTEKQLRLHFCHPSSKCTELKSSKRQTKFGRVRVNKCSSLSYYGSVCAYVDMRHSVSAAPAFQIFRIATIAKLYTIVAPKHTSCRRWQTKLKLIQIVLVNYYLLFQRALSFPFAAGDARKLRENQANSCYLGAGALQVITFNLSAQ